MRYLLVGDVHGCVHTFQNFLKEHFDPKTETLIQLGDLVDRGHFIIETLDFCALLRKQYGEKAIFLLGNHEDAMQRYIRGESDSWLQYGGAETIEQFQSHHRDLSTALHWIDSLPVFLDLEHLFLSHAGKSVRPAEPGNLLDSNSLIWARGLLKNLGKPQVVGHSPLKKPFHVKESNTFYIDTGAVYGNALAGVKLCFDRSGKLLNSQFCQTLTVPKDFEGAAHLKREPHSFFDPCSLAQ